MIDDNLAKELAKAFDQAVAATILAATFCGVGLVLAGAAWWVRIRD